MAILVKGKTFTSTEQVTSTKLHQLVDSATFDPAAADGSTLEVSGGALRVKDGGITGAKLSSTVAIPGAATATTQPADTNTTAIATTAFAKKEADDAQAYAIQRANHTGTQSYTTITGLGTASTASSAQVCKAWCNFNGTLSGTITPKDSYNIASIVKNGTGDYTITFTNAMGNANYSVVGSSESSAGSTGGGVHTRDYLTPRTASLVRIGTTSFGPSNTAVSDQTSVSIAIFSN